MRHAHIIIIGKTGAGKSTLVNAIIGEKVAPTGKVGEKTRKNAIYTCVRALNSSFSLLSMDEKWELNIYDTVGLELNEKITETTLRDVEQHLINTRNESSITDVIVVWLCVNQRSNRCEDYELSVVDKMSLKYEVPFSILLTQCISDEESDLERKLRLEYPDTNVKRVLAEDFHTRVGVFPAFGVEKAVRDAICNYNQLKINVLQSKLNNLREEKKKRIERIRNEGRICIGKHTENAGKIGYVPAACIPFVHGVCIKMLTELDRIAGIDTSKGFADEVFANVLVGIVATPFMVIPLLSKFIAESYVETIGETYFDALLAVIERSTDDELKNNEKVEARIKEELEKRRR